jgi:hypothetical protein
MNPYQLSDGKVANVKVISIGEHDQRRKEHVRASKARNYKKMKDELDELRQFKKDTILRCRTATMMLTNHFPPGGDEASKTVQMIKNILDPLIGFMPQPNPSGLEPLYIGPSFVESFPTLTQQPLPTVVQRALYRPVFVPVQHPAKHTNPFQPHPSVAGTQSIPVANFSPNKSVGADWHPSKSQFPTIGAFHQAQP